MPYARAARSLGLAVFLAGVLGGGSAAQVPLLVDGTLMSPLGGSEPSGPSSMPGCDTARQRTLTPAEQEAENFRRTQVSGRALHEGIRGVTKGLPWFENLAAASRVATMEQKPILWVHLLGELDGFT